MYLEINLDKYESNFVTIWQNDNILLDDLMLHIFLRNKINSDITIKLLDKLEKIKTLQFVTHLFI